jgi:orotidine-5'-phosphate decarboxylase
VIIDRLYELVAGKGHVCVGLDTSIEYLPRDFHANFNTVEDAMFGFNKKIIDATFDIVSCYKLQIAFYEAVGIQGLLAYRKTLRYLRSIGAFIITDIKRGDIASTAQMYARAHFEGDFESDMITLNLYMGMDGLTPYLPYIKEKEKGVFILVKTSNPGSKDIQLIAGENGEKVYETVAKKISEKGGEFRGKYAYSAIGAVVGCTNLEEAASIRKQMENTFFLIPGYGAQGGTAADIKPLLSNKNGGVVNSSRAVLLAYKNPSFSEYPFDMAARKEVLRMKGEIADHL